LQIDFFGQSVLVENTLGQQILYTIEQVGELFYCSQQKRRTRAGKWSEKRIVDSSQQYMRFEFAETEAGFKINKENISNLRRIDIKKLN
jgi:hypothetical protein